MNLDSKTRERIIIIGVAVGAVLLFGIIYKMMPKKPMSEVAEYKAWDESVVDAFLALPVQHDGRVKPMTQMAFFDLLGLRSKTSVKFKAADEKAKINHKEWILDTFFRPSVAKTLPMFVVDDSDAVTKVGALAKTKKDYYSYAELFDLSEAEKSARPKLPREKLFELAREYQEKEQQLAKEEKDENLMSVESQVMLLAKRVNTFEYLSSTMLPANPKEGFLSEDLVDENLRAMAEKFSVSKLITELPETNQSQMQQIMMRGPQSQAPLAMEEFNKLRLAFLYSNFANRVRLFPPTYAGEDVVLSYFESAKTFTATLRQMERISGIEPAPDTATISAQIDHLFSNNKKLEATINRLDADLSKAMRYPDKKMPKYLQKEKIADSAALNEVVQSFYHLRDVNQDPNVAEWKSVGQVIQLGLESEKRRPWAVERLKKLEALAAASKSDDPKVFEKEIMVFRKLIEGDAAERGEMRAIPLDIKYREKNHELMAKVLFVIAFTILGLCWISPQSQLGKIAFYATAILGTWAAFNMISMIAMRMEIMERPPITNLFDTFLFIGALGFILGLIIELMTHRRIAISAGVLLGGICALLLGPFREVNTTETLSPLVAVLDTNFWLWTHVTVINAGYCGGLLAALAAHFYIIGSAIGLNKESPKTYRSVARIIYAMVCFTLFFSLVGTVLGGIWANYSWGRFWGWDPKENGALMIVLWCLAILHARLGGYIKDLGICVTTIILGVIISFSWFGVNALGVGLHSYGFASGIMKALTFFWVVEGILLVAALYIWLRDSGTLGKLTSKPEPQ